MVFAEFGQEMQEQTRGEDASREEGEGIDRFIFRRKNQEALMIH